MLNQKHQSIAHTDHKTLNGFVNANYYKVIFVP